MKAISVDGLGKSFGSKKLFSNLSFSVERGEIVAILGPNGCGKTTLMNILSGVIKQSSGETIIPSAETKEFSYIFQNYRESLLPWKNNYDNIALPLVLNGKQNGETRKKIAELDKMFGFEPQFDMYPYELSGGQQQILAFIRALITKPKVLLIDEPFSALDYENNLNLRAHLLEYHSRYVPTILIITHNIEEAVHLASRIIVLSKKPTEIVEIIENNDTYPRKINYLNSKSFFEIKEKVLNAFQRGVSA